MNFARKAFRANRHKSGVFVSPLQARVQPTIAESMFVVERQKIWATERQLTWFSFSAIVIFWRWFVMETDVVHVFEEKTFCE